MLVPAPANALAVEIAKFLHSASIKMLFRQFA